jgi:hypothetical protein
MPKLTGLATIIGFLTQILPIIDRRTQPICADAI